MQGSEILGRGAATRAGQWPARPIHGQPIDRIVRGPRPRPRFILRPMVVELPEAEPLLVIAGQRVQGDVGDDFVDAGRMVSRQRVTDLRDPFLHRLGGQECHVRRDQQVLRAARVLILARQQPHRAPLVRDRHRLAEMQQVGRQGETARCTRAR